MDFLNLENRKVKGHLTVVYNCLVREYNVDENRHRNTEQNKKWQRPSCRVGNSDYTLEDTFIRKVIKHWVRWHEEVVKSLCLN